MMRATIAAGGFTTALVLLWLACAAPDRTLEPESDPAAGELHPGVLYGRITTVDGATYEGRLRWGDDQEAFWGDYFNGAKNENPWTAHAPLEQQPTQGRPIEIFGFRLGGRERARRFDRLFLGRFGDIARIEAHVRSVQVTLKSGTVFELNRFEAGDIDDGVRVWDDGGVVDIDARRIRTIEFLPTAPLAAVPARLHGTVRTIEGEFTGFIQWDRQEGAVADELDGRSDGGDLSLRYDTIRAIARRSRDSALVTLVDNREVVLSSTREVGHDNRGISVEDTRYGRVLISWDAFERVDFTPGGNGPAYGDFAPGRALAGSVTTRDGRRLAGRLVYDFDESETTETFDASSRGVDYNIPFGLIRSIVPAGRDGGDAHRARLILHDGEELPLERTGDFGDGNAGMLIFVPGREHPEYVPWTEVRQVDLDRPPSEHR